MQLVKHVHCGQFAADEHDAVEELGQVADVERGEPVEREGLFDDVGDIRRITLLVVVVVNWQVLVCFLFGQLLNTHAQPSHEPSDAHHSHQSNHPEQHIVNQYNSVSIGRNHA